MFALVIIFIKKQTRWFLDYSTQQEISKTVLLRFSHVILITRRENLQRIFNALREMETQILIFVNRR